MKTRWASCPYGEDVSLAAVACFLEAVLHLSPANHRWSARLLHVGEVISGGSLMSFE